MECPKCKHSWDYKGKSTYYLTCPHCYSKIRPSAQQEQIPTTQQEQMPITQPEPDIEALKRKVAEYEENHFKERVDAMLSKGNICFTPRSRQFSCLQCNATFVSYPFSEFCPVCGSKALRLRSKEEIEKFTIENNTRFLEALEKRKAEIKEEKKAASEATKKAKMEATNKAKSEKKAYKEFEKTIPELDEPVFDSNDFYNSSTISFFIFQVPERGYLVSFFEWISDNKLHNAIEYFLPQYFADLGSAKEAAKKELVLKLRNANVMGDAEIDEFLNRLG